MESESKRRSGSFGSQKTTPLSSDEARRLSLSEGSIVDNVSPESSEAGTLKKPRKFKPRKFIAKTFKRKKSEKSKDEQDQNTGDSGLSQSEQEISRKSSVVAKFTEKLSSPKLNRFNLMKRFSGRRSYQVTPMNDDAVEDGNTTKLGSLSVSESSLRNEDAQSEPSTELLDFEEKEEGFVAFEEREPEAAPKQTVTLESKKVQLKITISGKKVEKRATPSPSELDQAIDKASPEAIVTSEPILRRTDIILPSSSTQVRLSAGRDQFFSEMFSPNNDANVEHELKPIKGDSPTTFAAVVKEGFSVKPARAEGSNEVEKYLILTSSLNSIISAAKELDDLSSKVENLKFPELGELKIHELSSETEETPATGSEVKSETVEEPSEDIAEGPEPVIENIIEPEVANNFVESSAKTTKLSDALASSTPIRAESEEEEDEMRKQNKKSKIPRKSSSTDVEKLTVHTQEPQKPYNVTLSSSSSEEFKSPTGELKPEEIKFEVGTPVRPLRTSSASGFAPLALPEPISNAEIPQDSVDEIFHSPKSESSLSSVTTRRKIAYVPQLTIYTAEEQEILKRHIEANTTESFDTCSLPPDSSVFPTFDDSVGNTMTSSPDKREYLYKILVIGELGTGKTSFIKRYVHQFFSTNYRATIGVDFALKVLQWDTSTTIRLQLWDIAGQERFGNMTRVYYKEAVGAFIVFDVTRSATFDAAIKWKQDLDTKVQLPDGSPIPCILLANKCDQQKQGLVTMPAKMDEYCKQNGFAGWFETSAKDNLNIEESAKALVSKILFNDKLIQNELDGDRLVLNADDPNNPKKKFCSC